MYALGATEICHTYNTFFTIALNMDECVPCAGVKNYKEAPKMY